MFKRIIRAMKMLLDKLRAHPRPKVASKPVVNPPESVPNPLRPVSNPPQQLESHDNNSDVDIELVQTRKTFSDMEWEEGRHTPREHQELRLAARMSEAPQQE